MFYIPFIFYYCQQVLFTLRVSSLQSALNEAFVDFPNDEGYFQFSPEAEFTSSLYDRVTFATDTGAESPCFAQLLQC